MDLQQGANQPLRTASPRVTLTTQGVPQGMEIDASAFVLGVDGKVLGDAAFIFYGQKDFGQGAVTLGDPGTFTLDLGRLERTASKIQFVLTIHEGTTRRQTFGQITAAQMQVHDGGETITFRLPTAGMAEAALIMGEIYRHKEQWKVRAVGQGFVGGLAALASHLGVDITEERPAQPPAAAPAAPPPSSAESAPGVRLHKVVLEKNKPVSLEKGRGLGEMLINLNWNRSPAGQQSRGLLQRLRGSGGIDLDLGCMAAYRDGQKTVIQALGENFGFFEQWPYLQLMGDDRTGSATEGENLRLNGAYWDQFERALVYAFIYEGVPNWAQTDGVVTIRAPGHPELVVNMDSTASNERCCAIALLENEGGNIRISKQVRYFRDQQLMDEGFGFGFRWAAGRK